MKKSENIRALDELRNITINTNYTMHALSSVLVEFGNTKVICAASIENRVPQFLKDSGKGWLTAEYAMLPSSTGTRKKRENYKNGPDGRSIEIQRLIGRALRQSFNLDCVGEKSIYIDCDVIQADGGTRTAAITGGYVALAIALKKLEKTRSLSKPLQLHAVAAVSCGIVNDEAVLDLCYEQDSAAQADGNFVMRENDFVEIQLAGEKRAITQKEMLQLMDIAQKGIGELYELQQKAIEGFFQQNYIINSF